MWRRLSEKTTRREGDRHSAITRGEEGEEAKEAAREAATVAAREEAATAAMEPARPEGWL